MGDVPTVGVVWKWAGYTVLDKAPTLCPWMLSPCFQPEGIYLQFFPSIWDTSELTALQWEFSSGSCFVKRKNSYANMAVLLLSAFGSFLFFLRYFFLLGWSVQIVLKVNTEMSKSDFYLSHKRDNSCWTLGWVPDLSWCYCFRLRNDL